MRITDAEGFRAMPQKAVHKKPTNVTVEPALLEEARSYNINLSRTLEVGLRDAIAERKRRQWLEDNADSLDRYNRRVAARGLFSDKARAF